MLLTSENVGSLTYKKKKVKLEHADAEFYVALIPVSLIKDAKDAGDSDEIGLKVLQCAVVDANNNPVFESYDTFASLPPAVQKEIMDAVWDYNALTEVAHKELVKNLETTQEGSSVVD